MTSEKLVYLLTFLCTLFKGNYFLNSTRIDVPEVALIKTQNENLLAGGLTSASTENSSISTEPSPEQTTDLSELKATGINSTAVSRNEIVEIFHGVSNNTNATIEITVNSTILRDCVNISSANVTCAEPLWNDTAKTNYTLVAEAVEGVSKESFRLEKSAAVAAGVFLVSAVLGYLSCVVYRRFLQRKYGNSQILIAEEVYDTTDLRYFEI